jgi:ubiquitin-protein ligase
MCAAKDLRLANERDHLLAFQRVLAKDSVLKTRYEILGANMRFTSFQIRITGLDSLKISSNRFAPSSTFNTQWTIPSNYPEEAIPVVRFMDPIPFNPHVFESGAICWGQGNKPNPNIFLADWLLWTFVLLSYYQEGTLVINTQSPANGNAMKWYIDNRSRISRFVPKLDYKRLRFWLERTRG